MSDPCAIRVPNTFYVTVMSTDGVVITTVQHPVATTIHVVLPQNVDKCSLIVRIRVQNSAGTSSPTEMSVGKLPHSHNQVLHSYSFIKLCHDYSRGAFIILGINW